MYFIIYFTLHQESMIQHRKEESFVKLSSKFHESLSFRSLLESTKQ